MSRPLLVIIAFVLWAAGSTYLYTCKLKRVCAADSANATSTTTTAVTEADNAAKGSPMPATNPAGAAAAAAISTTAASGNETKPAPALVATKPNAKPVRVLFPIRKARRHPNDAVTRQMQSIADQLKVSGRAIVTGFTDERGGEDMNMNLAQRRAEAVRDELIAMGAPAALIDVMAVGPQTPLASNDTIMGRQMNRRVDITLQ